MIPEPHIDAMIPEPHIDAMMEAMGWLRTATSLPMLRYAPTEHASSRDNALHMAFLADYHMPPHLIDNGLSTIYLRKI